MEISKLAVAGIACGALILGGFGGCAFGYGIGSISSSPTTSGSAKSDSSSSPFDLPTTTTAPAVPPSMTDFVVEVAVSEQKCFGSAGCNYELVVNPTYIGSTEINGKWLVIYEITGGEDPQTGNFTIDGGQIRWDSDKRISGSAGAVFTAQVVRVVKQY
ncbi:hypothetical protein 32HC_46 [Mycobacterium phage 32HC]|uniref:Lipoprotein n=1 Tax=Mycobacterium phage 32HC TaxID=1445729 RepID=W8E8T5_9CAUD|nr:hypothetical protein ST32HC_46 [Mycobacterium phage 32HC]AHJ86324.1 hypothetical protein 32HC_46 [Mycobacterium phage 32HC]